MLPASSTRFTCKLTRPLNAPASRIRLMRPLHTLAARIARYPTSTLLRHILLIVTRARRHCHTSPNCPAHHTTSTDYRLQSAGFGLYFLPQCASFGWCTVIECESFGPQACIVCRLSAAGVVHAASSAVAPLYCAMHPPSVHSANRPCPPNCPFREPPTPTEPSIFAKCPPPPTPRPSSLAC
ncbi:hypothetical protein GGX14DRAFT_558484 [Mycena pura]|uniref:Uncharacterized protein n=1 Tax=Mycena pura TaxID=153505 RepID=A0AAD6YKW4_9AGAR|nr:hypothetical protein GGX14DRAFT_558484 [Mycena pura]